MFDITRRGGPVFRLPAAAGTWYFYNNSTLYSTPLIQLQVRMVFGRGFSCQLFEIEVESIATHKQGFLGQGVDGVRQQVPLPDQRNGIIDAQHIDILPIRKISIVLE